MQSRALGKACLKTQLGNVNKSNSVKTLQDNQNIFNNSQTCNKLNQINK